VATGHSKTNLGSSDPVLRSGRCDNAVWILQGGTPESRHTLCGPFPDPGPVGIAPIVNFAVQMVGVWVYYNKLVRLLPLHGFNPTL